MPKCPNCNHKNDFWDVNKMKLTHEDTESFIKIKGCHKETNYYPENEDITLFGCPKCFIVFWKKW